VVLRGAGYTAKDAAEQVGLTLKAAESRLARLRKNLREERASPEPRTSKRSDTTPGGR
jgi:DNA-directed RNA polymerase specialized sigma24 family protein